MKIKWLMKVIYLFFLLQDPMYPASTIHQKTVKAGILWTTSGSFHGMKKGVLVDDGGTDIDLLYSLYYTFFSVFRFKHWWFWFCLDGMVS